ncbi:MAG: thiamine-phosphate kinase [bacterium]
MASEFDLIRNYFQPLAGKAARNLQDDVAWLRDERLVITKDLIVSGTHFLPSDPLNLVAQKALRVNISDCIAKGAKPFGYFLGLVLPQGFSEKEIALMAQGLAQDQSLYDLELLGGDTTQSKVGQDLIISITMLAYPVYDHEPLSRSGAQPGDLIYVSGSIGDAYLGLQYLSGHYEPEARFQQHIGKAYQLPRPAIAMASLVAKYASASLDVSDGLLADARHLAHSSNLRLDLYAKDIPLSDCARDYLQQAEDEQKSMLKLLAGGDDYQTLCTIPVDWEEQFWAEAQNSDLQVSKIGICIASNTAQLNLLDAHDKPIMISQYGYDHFQ